MARREPPQGDDLFAGLVEDRLKASRPLAARMRPANLEQVVGQPALLGEDSFLRKAIQGDRVPSMVLYGPPGCGKTTLARVVAGATQAVFEELSAVSAGLADVRAVMARARDRLASGQRTVLFLDEIHRFNKAQQDVVLPYVENGDVILLGATTENPSFEVNSALLSRSRVYVLRPLTEEDVRTIVRRALADTERGLGGKATLSQEAEDGLVAVSNGDARVALNALELANDATGGDREISLADIREALQRRSLLYDRAGDQHYDTISAFIKSVRGSDPDAALYWLMRMIDAGEDPMFIARRIVILAGEDVGLADPQALVIATAAQQATHLIGFPEGYYPLAEATVYLALAPKSDSLKRGLGELQRDLDTTRADPVPLHLRNAPTPLMKSLGYGKDYKYAHDFEGHVVPDETYLPETLKDRRYYVPTELGAEVDLKRRLDALRRSATAAGQARKADRSGSPPTTG